MHVKTLVWCIWLLPAVILSQTYSLNHAGDSPGQESFDLMISGGLILDGEGNPPIHADILVRDDEIVFIGKVDKNKVHVSRVIDARGKVVSPGFIDSHAHGDPLGNSSFENFLAMGVTTIVLGQDGSSPAPDRNGLSMKTWMDQVEDSRLELNIAMFVGHGSLRSVAGIPYSRAPDQDQLGKMQSLLTTAFEAGVFGMSTGLEYVPGIFAQDSELLALARIVGQHRGMIMSHMRSEDDESIEAAVDELIRQGQYCPVHISHIKVIYGKGKERAREILEKIDSVKATGIRISADVYPYNASYTGISIVFPEWAKTADQFGEAVRVRRQDLLDFLYRKVERRNGPEATLFTTGDYRGKTLEEVAREKDKSYQEVLMDIGPQGASGAYFVMDDTLQTQFIIHPEVMICSDGSPSMRHPRGYGAFAKILEVYVNQSGLLSLQAAIRKMTSLPAVTLGIPDRGRIAVGFKADMLIFDPGKIKTTADYVDPFQLAQGFDVVIINGKVVRENGKMLSRTAGRLLKKPKSVR